MSDKIECPYCNHEFGEDPEDAAQDEVLHIECPECEKIFTGYAQYEFSIVGIGKADCLNGGEHLLKESIGVPKGYPRRYRCQLCDDSGPVESFKKHKFMKDED